LSASTELREDRPAEGVLRLTLERPERHNVLDPALLGALALSVQEAPARGARAIVLRGGGERAFSAGFDLDLLTGGEADLEADRSVGGAARALLGSRLPVVAAIRGHCHGAGVELALSCDLRLAAADLDLSLGAVGLGVVYRPEFLARLAAMCGLGRALDLLLGRRRLGAAEALGWGLVTEVVAPGELDARALEVARGLASLPEPAVAGTKAALVLTAVLAEAELALAEGWRRQAAASDERRQALAAARARLRRSPG
jgi:enoyl-CoA hydratase